MDAAMQVIKAPFVQEFVRMADDGWKLGLHEANGGNLSYRLRPEEVAQVADGFAPGEWVPVAGGVEVPVLAGDVFMVSAAGSHFRSLARNPQTCAGLIEVGPQGATFRTLWGFADGGRPTSELPSHLLLHGIQKERASGNRSGSRAADNRVVYHAHPANANALASVLPLEDGALTTELRQALTEFEIVLPDGVGVLGRMAPGTVELGRATAELMRAHDAVVWANHGAICTGAGFDEALGVMHTVEKASEVAVKVRSMR